MRKHCLMLILCLLPLLATCSSRDLRQAVDYVSAGVKQVPLTEDEVIAGLKDALSRGISRGAQKASVKNGYLGNPKLKIEFPQDMRKVDKALRKIGLGNEVDRFVKQLNRSAELAAAKAKPIFIGAITQMTIRDAFEILNGEADAATRYLRRTTAAELHSAFMPVIGDALQETSATRYYDDILRRYNKIPFVRKVDPELDRYATERAVDGLFVLIAEEEARIRAEPRARTTQLLKRVFGSLD